MALNRPTCTAFEALTPVNPGFLCPHSSSTISFFLALMLTVMCLLFLTSLFANALICVCMCLCVCVGVCARVHSLQYFAAEKVDPNHRLFIKGILVKAGKSLIKLKKYGEALSACNKVRAYAC